MAVRVLIADDHELVRTGVRRLLEELSYEVVGEAESGEQAVELAREREPDIALIDIHMPGLGGLEASQRIGRFVPGCQIVILTAHDSGPLPRQLLKIGVAGFLTKGCTLSEMGKALQEVSRGARYVGRDVAQRLALGAISGDDGNPFDRLTTRELQVTLMLTAGSANGAIADSLKLSPKTVTTYRRRIMTKVEVETDADLLRLAIEHNLSAPES